MAYPKKINYLQGGQFAYDVIIDVGTTNGLEMNITNALPNSQTHNFTINNFVIEKQNATVFVTQDNINQVVDYYPYGKVLREYINGDQERYLTTQHERDQATVWIIVERGIMMRMWLDSWLWIL